jgi:hypothetical protein
MAYDVSARFSNTGVGTLLSETYWVPAIKDEFPMYTFWSQFLSQTWGDANIMGQGELFKVSYLNKLGVASTPLTAGTPIATIDGTGLAQVTGTLKEYGNSERITSFAEWCSSIDLQKASGISMARNAIETKDYLVGAAAAATTRTYVVNGTDTIVRNGTIAQGTVALNSTTVQAIATDLRKMGIPTFADGLYRWVGAPGTFDALKAAGIVYQSAAELGMPGLYTTGLIIKYAGFLFIEEMGAGAVTQTGTWSLILGADPVVGYDNFMRPDLIKIYPDDQNDGGRSAKILWNGIAGYTIPVSGVANSRVWKVYSA